MFKIRDLRKSGLLEDSETRKLLKANCTASVKLSEHRIANEIPTRKDTLKMMRPLYSCDCNDEDIMKLSHLCHERNVRSGDAIFEGGSQSHWWYILARGKVSSIPKNHLKFPTWRAEYEYLSFDTIGIADAMDGSVYSETPRADGFAVIFEIDIVKTYALMQQHPGVNNFISRLCAEHVIKRRIPQFVNMRPFDAIQAVAAGRLIEKNQTKTPSDRVSHSKVDQSQTDEIIVKQKIFIERNFILLRGICRDGGGDKIVLHTLMNPGDYEIDNTSVIFVFVKNVENYDIQAGRTKSVDVSYRAKDDIRGVRSKSSVVRNMNFS